MSLRGQLGAELDVAMRLAKSAGAAILTHYQPGVRVDYKGAGQSDPVTDADRRANHIIVEGLREAFPQDGILAEESPPDPSRHARRRLWCVDPLDGTREFIDHNGEFAVMIGLAVDGAAVLGVVFEPAADRLYFGGAGEAFVEAPAGRTALRVSDIADPRAARLVVSRSHRSATVTKVAAALGIGHELPLGSVGLKASRVASATADVYLSVSNRTHEWDACAPEAILTAAGGRMTDILGSPLVYNKLETETPHGLCATNGRLHAACVAALAAAAAERGWR